MSEVKLGKVTHYYDKIGVCVILLEDTLIVGDTIRFVRGGEDLFEQKVDSIQLDHKSVDNADKGSEIGLKTLQPVKTGAEIYKVQ